MVEREVEARVVERIAGALAARGIGGAFVFGAWQPAEAGTVKGREPEGAAAVVAVAASPKSCETFAVPKADVPCAVALMVRDEADPDGTLFAACAGALSALLDGWHLSLADVKRDLASAHFSPAGLRLDGGSVSHDEAQGAWTAARSFTVRGVFRKET